MLNKLSDFQKLRHRYLAGGIFAFIALLATSGCGKSEGGGGAGPAMGGPQGALEVGVSEVEVQEVTLTQELPGRVSAYRLAEVRARVDGIVEKRLYEEGAEVKAGDVLYQIDPAPYEATLHSAQASLLKAKSNVESAQLKEQRYKKLVDERVASAQDYEDAAAALHEYEADVMAAQADVEAAQIDLDYTQVSAPVDGIAGLSEVTEGAYVQQSEATLMTTIRQIDPVYVDVTQSTAELLQLRQSMARGELNGNSQDRVSVRLILEDGTEYEHEGRLEFADAAVSKTTSSVTLRAVFPNPDLKLLPGMFVRARLIEGIKSEAILAPQSSVSRNEQGKPTAYVVGEDSKAELRVLEVARAVGNQWLVNAGLEAGDMLITDNLQSVSDGMAVKPVSAAEQQNETTGL